MSLGSPPQVAPSAGDNVPARVPGRSIAAFLAAYLGAYLILVVPVASTLAIKVADVQPEGREAALGIVAAIGAFIAIVANPVFGALSDRTTSRFGMRRPWVLGGAIGGIVTITVLATAGDIVTVGIAWAGVQLSMNAVLAGLAAFLPDQVPEQQRAKVSALAGIAQQFAPLIGLIVANIALAIGFGTPGMFLVPSSIGLVLIVIYVATANDRVLASENADRFSFMSLVRAFSFNPKQNPDFGWAWLGRFLIILSFSFGTTYQVYFLNARFGIPIEEVIFVQLGLVLLSSVMLTVSATISGILSDKLKRRKIFVFISSGLVALSSLITAFSFDLWVYVIAAGIAGLAIGAYFAVDLALVTEVLPDIESAAAKDMGIFNIANALPQSLAPAIAPVLLAVGGVTDNYIALFLGAAVFAILGAITVLPIKKVR
jgi:MFS family permease